MIIIVNWKADVASKMPIACWAVTLEPGGIPETHEIIIVNKHKFKQETWMSYSDIAYISNIQVRHSLKMLFGKPKWFWQFLEWGNGYSNFFF